MYAVFSHNIGIILSCLTALTATIISYKAYKNSHRLRQDTWIKTYREVQNDFWFSADCEKVRMWIDCNEEYEKVKQSFLRRVKGSAFTNKIDFENVEIFDRFLTCIDISNFIGPLQPIHKLRLKHEFIFELWLKKILAERSEMFFYIKIKWENTVYQTIEKIYREEPETINNALKKISKFYEQENL